MHQETQPSSDSPVDNANYQHPEGECDLIMKGGVTSGVVYPSAVLELAKKYRFRAVGGTSAGAIAAAATAAAEFGREKDSSPEVGFAGLGKMMDELKQEGFLLHLFQPDPRARPLFDAVLKVMDVYQASDGERRGSRLLEWVQKVVEDPSGPKPRKHLPLVTLRGSAELLAWPALSIIRSLPRPLRVLATGSTAWSLVRLVRGLASTYRSLKGSFEYVLDKDQSFYALCTGNKPASSNGANKYPALTPWLHARIQQLASLGPTSREVLTLGMLRNKRLPKDDASIDFQMVTTNLSQRQPYTLHCEDTQAMDRTPPSHPEELEAGYLFREHDMLRLFPEEVVTYLKEWTDPVKYPDYEKQWTRDSAAFEGFDLLKANARGFFPFPSGNALPVLVATRMSLSFPLLLGAVRLYSIKSDTQRRRSELGTKQEPYELKVSHPPREDDDLRENWFSDGGIASNFPIHIFDAWLPERPTFGINLADSQLPMGVTGPREAPIHRREGDVFLAQPRHVLLPHVYPISSLLNFLGSIFDTAQNYRDNTQARMPSYRERVVHVRLQPGEGGLNLKMNGKTIEAIAEKGAEAARTLEREFSFDQHQWVRLLVLLGRLEHEFVRLRKRYERDAQKKSAQKKDPDRMERPAAQASEQGTGNGQTAAEALPPWRLEMSSQYKELLKRQFDAHTAKSDWYRSRTGMTPQEWEAWKDESTRRMDALVEFISNWTSDRAGAMYSDKEQPYFFAYDEPIPEGILRVTPEH